MLFYCNYSSITDHFNADQSMTEEEATVAKKNSDSFDGDDISNLENALLTLQNEQESSNEQPVSSDILK